MPPEEPVYERPYEAPDAGIPMRDMPSTSQKYQQQQQQQQRPSSTSFANENYGTASKKGKGKSQQKPPAAPIPDYSEGEFDE